MRSKIQNYLNTNGLDAFKQLAYHQVSTYEHSCILDSCQLNTGVYGGKYEFLVALDSEKVVKSYQDFAQALDTNQDWFFGILGYDIKNEFESLESTNNEIISTPELLFFIPKTIVAIDKHLQVHILKGNPNLDSWNLKPSSKPSILSKTFSPISHFDYLKKIEEIHELIKAGDVYELNYCVPFSHTFTSFCPVEFQLKLLKKSPVPMAAYLKAEHLHLCGASMERYMTKTGYKLWSQPIKGTIKKGGSPEEDAALIKELESSEKDIAENVMIVDLVRNDFAKVCKVGSVVAQELFGIYSYLQVHQMISTVKGILRENLNTLDVLKATFPMGSMTGAPKIAAMQHIEELEDFKRGWYSGALGYITPEGDFDFNVVIRSVLCDSDMKTLNYNAGGAITIDSIPEKEWNEVQLKTKAITEVLSN
ncbi:anthranilate synthase component I family protein [Bacteroidia bacterium]|nr:anthranilate synthase component I family protein [Bacteroidia bacterium]MDB4107197.1 anthranilate synthase component I family protein [Bacteroidia bacterium]MDB9881888.1 anthranilate synthase component I family protein [Bacteroidia bacterium]MDC1394921.1 anthranilate synthase component I family protein [Bacteroidia bacterium]